MAVLQKIRNKSVFLLIIVGLALAAFIVGDALQNGTSYFYSSKNQIAQINGKAVSYKEYRNLLNENIELFKASRNLPSVEASVMDQLEDQTWQEIINKNLLEEEFKKLGVAVTDKEIAFLINSTQDPFVRQFFGGATGRQISTWVANLEGPNSKPQDMAQWLQFKKYIRGQNAQKKYFLLINKAMKYPNAFMEQFSALDNKQVDIQYVTKSYAAIMDNQVSASEDEIEKYYNDYKEKFIQQKEERTIDYIEFPVLPSEKDFKKTLGKMEEYRTTLSSDKLNYRRFVNRYSDKPNDDNFYNKSQMDEDLVDFAFSEKKGAIYGPELLDGFYILSKITDIKRLPDSVRVRHILLDFNKRNFQEATLLADSVEKLLDKPRANFSELAREFSDDENTAINGGDLGWINPFEMVRAFSDTVFNAKRREIKRVTTRFGIHIVQVTRKSRRVKKVRCATLRVRVAPSQETHDKVWRDASLFLEKIKNYTDFQNVCKSENKTILSQTIDKSSKELPSLPDSKEIIKQSLRAEKPFSLLKNNSNSPLFELDEKIVIGYLSEINEKGFKPLSQVSEQIKTTLQKEKKYQHIVNELTPVLATSSSLEEISEGTRLKVHDAANITFGSSFVDGLGLEPAVVAASIMLDEGAISMPIRGNSGVYLIQVNSSRDVIDEVGMVNETTQRRFTRNPQFEHINMYQSLLENSDIVDNRYRF